MYFYELVIAHDIIATMGEDRDHLVGRVMDLLENTGNPLSLKERARLREFCREIELEIGTDNHAYREISGALDALDALDGPTSGAEVTTGG